MNLVSPERLIWLLAALPIVVFYVLRTRLKKRVTSTLKFWDQLFEEKRQRSLWQRLRHWLSLLLQLVFLLLVVGAIIDPLWHGQQQRTRQVVLVLDNSASMHAIDARGESRFDRAIRAAQGVVRGIRAGDEIALVTTGSSVRVVVGMTDFAPAVLDALEEVTVTDGPTRVLEGIETARRLSGDPDKRQLIVISDFAFRDAADLSSDETVDVIPIGEEADNVAVTNLSVRRSLVDPIGYAMMLELQNFGQSDTKTRLTIQLDEELVDVLPIQLAAGQVWKKTLVGASKNGGILRATIDSDDALRVDNESIAIVPPRKPIPVTLVSEEPSLYLESVLSAIPLVELSTTARLPQRAPEGGFLVLHRIAPEQLPSGNVFAIDPRGDCDFWKIGEVLEQAIVARQENDSPLMPHVSLVNVSLPGSRVLEMASSATPLLTEVGGGTLMASHASEERRLVVLASDLGASDLPLRIAFPVLMTNAVNWFLGRSGEMEPALKTGYLAKTELPRDLGAKMTSPQLTWSDSGGSTGVATVQGSFVTVGPLNHVGIATIERKPISKPLSENDAEAESTDDSRIDELVRLAVNLSDADESDLRPRADFPTAQVEHAGAGRRPIWFYLTIVAFGLILLEWFLYQRRVVA